MWRGSKLRGFVQSTAPALTSVLGLLPEQRVSLFATKRVLESIETELRVYNEMQIDNVVGLVETVSGKDDL